MKFNEMFPSCYPHFLIGFRRPEDADLQQIAGRR